MPGPRILVLDHTAQEGGAELALLRLAEALGADADLRVLLFADGPLRDRLTDAGVRTAVLPLDPAVATASRDGVLAGAARSAISAIGFIPRLVRAIRGAKPELVVANSLKSAVFAAIAAPLAGRRWAWHLHDRLAPDYLPAVLVTAMRAIAAVGPRIVVANSAATRATLPARARRRAVIAYPGLPPEAFVPAAREGTAATPTVGIIGRISATKGQREFLEAAALLAARRDGLRFAVVGAALFGEEQGEPEMRQLADRLGIGDRVEFTGWVSDVPRRLRALDVVVHASPVPEPFGQVIVEAMAAGVPVVATAAGGVPEILDPGDPTPPARWRATPTGVLTTPGDAGALADALEAVLDDPAAAAARATAARADAAERFTIERTADVVRSAWGSARAGARAARVR